MKHNQVRQVLFPILAALIWGTAFVAQDLCADAIDTFTFNAIRSYIAVAALLVLIVIFDAVNKDKPSLTAIQRKAANRQMWFGGICCGTALAVASNFQPVPTPVRRASSPPCMWCWCRCSACSSSGR